MKLFKIVKDNQKSLRIRSTDVSFPLDENTKETLFNMLEYLKLSQDEDFASKNNIRSGVGLAAPQIGINKNMLAMYYYDEKNVLKQYILINPKIVSESVKQAYIAYGEGCLSVDKEHNGYVYRPYKVKVQAYDLLKEKFQLNYQLLHAYRVVFPECRQGIGAALSKKEFCAPYPQEFRKILAELGF